MFPILRAQAPSGTLSGTVYDGSGSVLPAAGVSLLNEATRDFRITAANTEGFFSLIAISPGTYTLQIEFPGFVAWRRTGIVLRVSDRINIPSIVLEVSSSSDEVTVTGSWSGLFPADNGEKAAIITKNEMQNLAIVGRSAVDLMKILPGVVYTGTGFPGEMGTFGGGLGQYHVAGGRADGVAILSDGADVIDPGCDCGAAVTPNVDLVSEVKVQVAAYGADQAKGPVVFQSVSKSGSTEFHGESYVYWRTNSFASQDWRANHFGTPKPEEKYYFPGFNVGGPLSKSRDRLFFFAGFEWMGQNFTEGDIPAVVPTAGMRLGDFTEVCSGELVLKGYNGCPANDFWGNWTDPGFEGLENGIIDPDLFDPGGKALTNLYPLPNRDPARIDGWNYVSNILRSQNRDQELARLDWTISDNTRLYTRFNHEFEGANYPYTLWWSNPEQVPSPSKALGNYHSWSSSTSLASVLSPSMTNEIVVAATYLNLAHELENPDAVSKTETGYPYQGIFDNHIDMIPSLLGASGFAMLYQAGGVINPGIFAKKWLTSLVDNFSKVFNTHTLKVGLRWAYTSNDEAPNPRAGDQGEFAFASWGDNATGNGYADLLLGRAASFGHSMTPLVAYLRRHEISGFIQDSWRASRRLTLDLGIRFDNNGFFHDREGHLAGFDASTYDPDAPLEAYSGVVAPYLGHDVPRSIWKSPGLLFSPRFGFAYDLSGSGRTVLRGGAGAYRYHGRGGNSMAGFSFNPPLVSTTWKCCGFFMWEMDQLDPDRTRSRFEGLEPYNDAYPATYSFSLTLSRRLPFDLFWETSYVGNTSSHLLGRRLLDAIPEGTMPVGANNDDDYRPYSSFISVGALGHMLSQNYHSLQVMLNRQTGSFNFSASYTLGKALGVGGDSQGGAGDTFDARHRSYGPLSYDRTHGFSIAYNWQLPNLTSRRILHQILNGWQLTGITQFQSGAPIRSLGLEGTTSDGVSPWNARDIVGTPDTSGQPFLICDPREGPRQGEWFNPRCFEAPTIGHNGHYAWPYFKGPGFQNHDLSLFKNWQIGVSEERKLQFRVSFFNVLNHPQPFFSGQELTLNFTEGVMTEETIQRDHVAGTSLKQGRRLVQFALKFMF